MTLYQIVGSNQPALVISETDGPGVLVNRDLVNICWISPDPGFNPGDVTASVLDPLVGIPFEGDTNIYACVAAGENILVDYIQDAKAWQPSPAQTANQIAQLGLATFNEQVNQNTSIPTNISLMGTPLLHGLREVTTQGITLTAGQSQSTAAQTISKPGYLIGISAECNAASANPFIQLFMTWQDSVTGFNVAQECWYIPMNAAANIQVYGKGPSKGNQLVVTVFNCDTANTSIIDFTVWETTHHIARDDWRSITPATLPAYTLNVQPVNPFPFGNALAGVLGYTGTTGVTINASSNKIYQLPLYCGQVTIFGTRALADAWSMIVYTSDPAVNINHTLILSNQSLTGTVIGPFTVSLPRTPCWLQILNGPAAADTFQFNANYLELVS